MFDNDASNSGGADDGLINPAGFVVRAGDLDTTAITAAASGVAGIGTGVVGAVDSVSTAWTTVKAPGVFETPDAGAVYALMDPAVAGAADMNGVTSRISSALETYAAELEAIKPDLEDIEQDAWDFRVEALAGYEVTNIEARGWLGSFTTGIDGNPVMMDDSYETTTISWREHDPAVAKNEKLVHRFEAILARVSTAATTCANAIQAELQLVCAAPFDAITAEALANSPEFSTWGAAVGEQRNVTESIGFGLANFGKGIWTGGELITGYDAQTGVRSWDTFWKTVGGLGDFVGSTLAVTNVPFMIAGIASMGTNTPFRNFFTDRINTVASSWGSIIGWDQQAHLAGENGWHKWEEDGIAAATESVANVGTFFIPVANIGKVVVVGTKVGSFIVRGVAGVAEFVVPAGSHLVTGVAKVVELTSTGVKTGFRGLINAIRDTHLNVTVKPTTVPGTLNTALDITHLDTPVKPGTAVSEALGLESAMGSRSAPSDTHTGSLESHTSVRESSNIGGADAERAHSSQTHTVEGQASTTVGGTAPSPIAGTKVPALGTDAVVTANGPLAIEPPRADMSLVWGNDRGVIDIDAVLGTQTPTPALGWTDLNALQFRIEPDTQLFWTGRTEMPNPANSTFVGSSDIATGLARQRGGTTLETYLADHGIKMPRWSDDPVVQAAWGEVSRMYAESASGVVRVVLGRNIRPEAVWLTYEFDALRSNSNVSKIIAIDPATGGMRVLYERPQNAR
ncbi:hypothetical protein RS84_02514 [Microbacterium hydrocarbonoxydans]|uniref:Uncharacterized protein n=1 Tax=Microbacterium hydrocarbonoxydans TaxID=273678 RepID=A0A0M2HS29_9MICO|nr:hypothetical protein [Microbacterium hydrocarbonoxydans]KJL47715.1 hypothetical protein RS84_02514 [Microbacterium hydrocarbonoxydans]